MTMKPGSMNPLDNGAALSSGGAGIATAQMIVDKGAQAVITGNVGPNAMRVLTSGGYPRIRRQAGHRSGTIWTSSKKEQLKKIETAVPAHSGMGGQGR